VEGSTRESDRANVRLGWRVTEKHRLNASYHYLDGERSTYPEQSGGPQYAVTDDLDASDYKDQVFALGWQGEFSPAWHSSLSANRIKHEEFYQSPGISPYLEVPPNGADTDFQRDQLQWVNTLQFSDAYQVNLGADYRHEEGDSTGYLEYFSQQIPTDFELDRDITALFGDVSASPIESLLLQGSLRYDDPDGFDSETSLRLGARYGFTPGLSLAANWGEGYKLPSFFALGHALVGNPDLLPEKASSWDLGVTWEASKALRLDATYFFNDFEDLVDFDPELFINVNRSQVETSGVELAALWQPLDRVSVRGHSTYTDIDVKDDESVLTGRPEWTAGLVTQWQVNSHWSTVLDYQWTGEQYAASLHTGESVTVELSDFHRVDWVLRWAPRDAVEIQFSVDNLFDESYETAVGFPAPGRAVRLGLRFTHQ
jgi:iron complex outermembrane receptor protein/vitamin B12 transporter